MRVADYCSVALAVLVGGAQALPATAAASRARTPASVAIRGATTSGSGPEFDSCHVKYDGVWSYVTIVLHQATQQNGDNLIQQMRQTVGTVTGKQPYVSMVASVATLHFNVPLQASDKLLADALVAAGLWTYEDLNFDPCTGVPHQPVF